MFFGSGDVLPCLKLSRALPESHRVLSIIQNIEIYSADFCGGHSRYLLPCVLQESLCLLELRLTLNVGL